MPRHYEPPRCQAFADETERRVCGHAMTPLGERDPQFGPSWKPGAWVFRCGYCGAIRALDTATLGRYVAAR